MKNRVTVLIAKQEYTLVAGEDTDYMKKVAAHVDAKVQEVLDGARVSSSDAAILAAQILAVEDGNLASWLDAARRDMAAQIEEKDAALQTEI